MNVNFSEAIKYIGCNDKTIDLFESQYPVPNGVSYNSYVILDDKVAVMDTADPRVTDEWLNNLDCELAGRKPDYLVVSHMEPDHAGSIKAFLEKYPDVTVVGNAKTFTMMGQFMAPSLFDDKKQVVAEGDKLSLGEHELTFVMAPMVHWPEVMVEYESKEKVLFSADGFGKFGALDVDEPWVDEARRYYLNIVGKYGASVQGLLKKAANLDIQTICPLHGPILKEDLGYYLGLYNTWSSYGVESEGLFIAYTSVYGNTKKAVELLAEKLEAKGVPEVVVNDLARSDIAECVEDGFRYDTQVFATTTFNNDIFPFMKEYIHHLTERNYQKKNVAFMENGSWAPTAAKTMKAMLEGCKELNYAENGVKIVSALNDESRAQIEALAEELAALYK